VERSPAVAALDACGEPATARLIDRSLGIADVSGTAVGLRDALPALAAVGEDDLTGAPASVAAWSLAAKLALDLVGRERLVPCVRRTPEGTTEARWSVALALAEDADRLRMLAEAFPPAAHAVPVEAPPSRGRTRLRTERTSPRSGQDGVAVWAPDALLRTFLDLSADAIVRSATADGSAKVEPSAPWEQRFVAALTSRAATFTPSGFRERSLLDELGSWARPALGVDPQEPRVCLRLELPAEGGDPGEPAHRSSFPLRYFLQAPRDPSLLVSARDIWRRPGALRRLGRTFEASDEHLLRSLAIAARIFPPIARSLRDAHPAAVLLEPAEAWEFIADAAPALVEAGIGVVVPAEFTRSGQRRLRLRLRVGGATTVKGAVPSGVGFGLDALIDFQWEAALDGEALSATDLAALARLKAPLVRWRGRWVAVDRTELADLREQLAAGGGKLSVAQALRAALAGEARRDGMSRAAEVITGGAFTGLVERLRAGTRVVAASRAPGLVGTLRDYQERGVDWLASMATYGLGTCLADDMGLGKTIQVLAYLLWRRTAAAADDRRPSLVVCPTSVVGNWEREIARFAPSLPVVRHYGSERVRSADALRTVPGGVVLTTYGLLRLDAAVLGAVRWDAAVLDEAQNIKNAASRTARAARALQATHRLALTGTPVENRLAELWSILEFADPGLLGPLEAFRREFAVPIERYRDAATAERLRRIVGPFVMRRLKSDPAVIRDLPPKQELKVVCSLTREQATLYQAAVDDALREIRDTAGIQRRGRVLALITALKQICDHPAHYLGESGPLKGRSGKLARLTEMLEEVVASGERALVFTQFREMGERLVAYLESALATDVLFLHGGVARAARDTMTRRFQEDERGPRIFVLSLRAGGTGLNLTAANHVFHFDRWWNPAVEDQASDRAYRIGQRRAVQVHALLTAGTVEEKVDRMLEEKRDLAARVVGAGERWITELDDASLRDLLALSEDAVVTADAPDREGAVTDTWRGAPRPPTHAARRRRSPRAEAVR
jgi:SNF2 domain-containing protein/SNF2 helicase protein/helicase-like protein